METGFDAVRHKKKKKSMMRFFKNSAFILGVLCVGVHDHIGALYLVTKH